MQPFDEKYVERREQRIQELFVLQAVARTSAGVAIVLSIASIFAAAMGGLVAMVLLSATLALWITAIFTYNLYRAQNAAEKAIQKEHEQMLIAYQQAQEKPKRHTRLSDEGEIIEEADTSISDTATSQQSI